MVVSAPDCRCGFRCKVCGGHTHEALHHRIFDWHEVIECTCADCQRWAVDVMRAHVLDLLNSPGGLAKVFGVPGR